MFSGLSHFLSVSVVFVLFGVGAFAETFPPSKVVWSAQQTYLYCKGSVYGWYPYETPSTFCREGPLVVSPGSTTLLILCYDNVAIGLSRTSGNSSSIETLGLVPRTGNLTLQITEPPQENITFESRCENPAPAETTAQKNSWKLPNNLNSNAERLGPCCALEFNVPTNYIGDLYYQDSAEDSFTGQVIIEANVTSTTTTPNSTTTSNTTTASGTTTTSTTTTTPPVPTSTPLPPNATTDVPTPTPTMNPTPTPTMVTNTTSPPTTINSTNGGANSTSDSLAAYFCTVLTMLIAFHPSYFSVL